MRKIDQIREKVQEALKDIEIYVTDLNYCIAFISSRNITGLQELVKAIVYTEEKKPKVERITTYYNLIEAKDLIDEYVKQLEPDGQYD